ncbi:DUF6402 family protein [Pseudomonas syringae group genomosp. 3]|uniref:Uncharacterized protein n=2 Tax=Pseudomonas syringae group genomosp. 3 TaxID=251701 RepID=D3NQ28_PSESM|nr:DUF6402 family protein [Pseudomonas syringae group genomosp. 3]ADD53001.1 protein of unknown function [Pseudomonas syringae pv. tomato str. DC3000]KKI26528.1 hypothetical protein WX98_08945 [Pseudomonas syringae pv. persicae]KPY88028.1 hypothetical protein ALO36_103550 [Pseudomonas syringae pv. tomato]MBF9247058.1 hypothetical protein [Pseudomonas syringae pv. tomato]MBW8024813.1 hypothetical protein [Pseudomonas syringae pv. tomato]
MTDNTVASSLTPASNQAGKTATVRQFKVSDIPAAMDKMKWPVAAALMRHWFNGKPWANASGGMETEEKQRTRPVPDEYIEENIVKMAWVLKFEKPAETRRILGGAWNNAKALPEIRTKILRAFGQSAPGCYPVRFNGKGREAEKFGYFNSRSVNFGQLGGGELDELRGALANFNMRVVAEGVVNVFDDKVEFVADRLGYYVEDNYDFSDGDDFFSQPLGYWNFDGVAGLFEANGQNAAIAQETTAIAKSSIFGMSEASEKRYIEMGNKRYFFIQNKHFVEYRKLYSKGGDFKIFSDIFYEQITPISIKFVRG